MSEGTLLALILGTTVAILVTAATLIWVAITLTEEDGGDDRA